MTEPVKLGSKYRHKLHGLEGIAIARTEYLSGCARVTIEYVKDGDLKEFWFDEPNLELVEELPENEPPKEESDRGGPRGMPPPRSVPPSRTTG